VNYRFTTHNRELLATLVAIPELDGQTFIELETIAEGDDVKAALQVVRSVLRELVKSVAFENSGQPCDYRRCEHPSCPGEYP
jgi:hypothetical protein